MNIATERHKPDVLLERQETPVNRKPVIGLPMVAGMVGGHAPTAVMTAVTLENVTVSYARHPAVHHVSGTFAEGSLTAIAGPNGAGKSTLLKAIAGIMRPDEGTIRFAGNRRHIAYLPQASDVERDFPLSLLHLMATGYWHKIGGSGTITKAMKTEAGAALEQVGLAGFERCPLSSLSAGQFQRALFARLLVQDAPLILLDEPFTSVDTTTTDHLLKLIARWHSQGRTVVCVLHDFAQISGHFPQCLLMARECIAWGETDKTLASEWVQTSHFHDSVTRANEPCERSAI